MQGHISCSISEGQPSTFAGPPGLPFTGLRLTVHQPNYFYRVSVIAKILCSNKHVLLDNVQFARREYQSRSRIFGSRWCPRWISIPVCHTPSRTSIKAAQIQGLHWRKKHRNTIRHAYCHAPFFEEVFGELVLPLLETPAETIADLGSHSLRLTLALLGYSIDIIPASRLVLDPSLRRSALLAEICLQTGAAEYLAGPGSRHYLDTEPFIARQLGILHHTLVVDRLSFALAEIRQAEMLPIYKLRQINILDLLFSLGPKTAYELLMHGCSALRPWENVA